jgi:hypothetical protein
LHVVGLGSCRSRPGQPALLIGTAHPARASALAKALADAYTVATEPHR